MSKLIGSEADFEEFLKCSKGSLVLFYAGWCPYSRSFLPVFEKHAVAGNCCRVVTDDMDGCEEKYSIDVVPTVLYFENGKVVRRLDGEPGAGLSEKQLIDMIGSCGLAEK